MGGHACCGDGYVEIGNYVKRDARFFVCGYVSCVMHHVSCVICYAGDGGGDVHPAGGHHQRQQEAAAGLLRSAFQHQP